MHRIFQDCMPDRWGRNLMLRAEHQDARSEHRTARTLFEGDLLLSVNDETRDKAHCASGTTTVTRELPVRPAVQEK